MTYGFILQAIQEVNVYGSENYFTCFSENDFVDNFN